MRSYRCCEVRASERGSEQVIAASMVGGAHPRQFARRCRDIAGWAFPGAMLALLPKCPACLAAYVAVSTGLGLSLSTATHLRRSLLVMCISSLLYVAVRHLCQMLVRIRSEPNLRIVQRLFNDIDGPRQ